MGCSLSTPTLPSGVHLADAVEAHFGDSPSGPELAAAQEQLVRSIEHINAADRDGVSLLDVQRGVFNLLQAGAYRTFRVAYAADYHTHKRDHSYPYLLSNFVSFAGAVLDLYMALKVVDAAHQPSVDALKALLGSLEASIRKQIKNWGPEDEAAFEARTAAVEEAAPPPLPPAAPPPPGFLAPIAASARPLYSRDAAAFAEGFGSDYSGDWSRYLSRYNRVLLDPSDDWAANERRGGAIAPVAFWYERFMPLLLEVCSLGVEGYAATDEDAAALDGWLAEMRAARNFDKYGADVLAGWGKCSASVKLSIKRAWRLSRHYLLGPQKQRERSSESGADHRETGDLSQYVAFLDVYLGRSYVEKVAGMRLTFPYWVGPSTWTWHHFLGERAAELVAAGDAAGSAAIVDGFHRYMGLFVTMYPCPYCRHHLNEYVVRNKEKDLYPVEYVLLGWTPSAADEEGTTTPSLKLAYVTDATRLRLFVWKLHNAVSGSIERSEEWYKATDSINTSRYWPNVYSTLHRAGAHSGAVSAARIAGILDVLDSAVKLSLLRPSILALQPGQAAELAEIAAPLVDELDQALLGTGFLAEAYGWSGRVDDKPPDVDFAEKRGAFMRDQHFTLA